MSLGACCGVRGLLIVGVVGRALLLLLAGGRRWSVVSSCLFFWSNGVDSCMLMRGRLLVDGLYVLLPAASVASGKKGVGVFSFSFSLFVGGFLSKDVCC